MLLLLLCSARASRPAAPDRCDSQGYPPRILETRTRRRADDPPGLRGPAPCNALVRNSVSSPEVWITIALAALLAGVLRATVCGTHCEAGGSNCETGGSNCETGGSSSRSSRR